MQFIELIVAKLFVNQSFQHDSNFATVRKTPQLFLTLLQILNVQKIYAPRAFKCIEAILE